MARRIVRIPDPIDPDDKEYITLDWTRDLKGRQILSQTVVYERNLEAFPGSSESHTTTKTQFPIAPNTTNGIGWVENQVQLDTGETVSCQIRIRIREKGRSNTL